MGNCIPFAPKITKCPVQKLSHTKRYLSNVQSARVSIESTSERLRVQSQLSHLLVESQLVFCLILFGLCPHPAMLSRKQRYSTNTPMSNRKSTNLSQSRIFCLNSSNPRIPPAGQQKYMQFKCFLDSEQKKKLKAKNTVGFYHIFVQTLCR